MHLHSWREVHSPPPPTTSKHLENYEKQNCERQEDEEHVRKKDEKEKILLVPPFPQILETKQLDQAANALLDELKNLYVKIPLLWVIREIPIYNKFIKETCVKGLGRNKRYPYTINVLALLISCLENS